MTLSPEDLRKLALAATPGHWFASPSQDDYKILQDTDTGLLPHIGSVCERENAAYIASVSPDVVIGLLDRIAALEAARDEACDLLDECLHKTTAARLRGVGK